MISREKITQLQAIAQQEKANLSVEEQKASEVAVQEAIRMAKEKVHEEFENKRAVLDVKIDTYQELIDDIDYTPTE